jgi:uroporphyrinogen-III synthase
VRLLVTRPESDSERTASALRARGHDVVLAPLMRIEAVANAEIGAGPWLALVMTSANALRAVAAHPRRAELTKLPVCVVGARTADGARGAGFSEVRLIGRDVAELIERIGAALPRGDDPLLYLAGEETSRDLAKDLAAQGFVTRTVVAYRAVKAERLPPNVGAALAAGELGGVLHFSRRSAEAYVECARQAGILASALAPTHYCLSRQVAEPLGAAGARDMRVALRPDKAALLALIDAKI